MTAVRRMKNWAFGGFGAALTLALSVPAGAQNSDAPIDVTAAPPPSAETIGPSQLRDFNLQGRVTRPADRTATTPAQPANTAAAPPRSGQAVPADAAAEPASRTPSSGASARPQSVADQSAPSQILPTDSQPVTPSQPLDVATTLFPYTTLFRSRKSVV